MQRMLVVLAVTACACSTGHAQILYSYVTNQSTYNLNVGQSTTVNLYLQEFVPTGSTSLINADGGLYGLGAKATSSGLSTAISTISNPAGNSSFATGGYSVTSGSSTTVAQIQNAAANLNAGSAGFASGPTSSTPVAGGTDLLYLVGSFQITGTGAGDQIYNLSGINPGTGTTSTFGAAGGPSGGAGYDLDVANGGVPNSFGGAQGDYVGTQGNPTSFTVDVAAVPEPSSVILTGLAFAGLAFGAYRRRLKNSTNEAITVA